jgi:hypothetical protein
VATSSPNLSINVGKSISDIGKADNCIMISSNFLEVDIISTSSSYLVNKILIASEKTQDISVSTYPNPVNDVLNIEIKQIQDNVGQAKLRLTHISGKMLLEWNTNLEKGTQFLTIPMEMYPSGVYVLTVDAGENQYTGKIIKSE